jgi:hypothetical protein
MFIIKQHRNSASCDKRYALKAHFRVHDPIKLHLQRLILAATIALHFISPRTDIYSVMRRTELKLKAGLHKIC